MKLGRENSKPISGNTALNDIKAVTERILNEQMNDLLCRINSRQPGSYKQAIYADPILSLWLG